MSSPSNKVMDALAHIQSSVMADTLRLQNGLIGAVNNFMKNNGVLNIQPLLLSPVSGQVEHRPLDPQSTPQSVVDDKRKTVPANIPYGHQAFAISKGTNKVIRKQLILANPTINAMYVIYPDVRLEPEQVATDGNHAFEFSMVDFELKEKSYEEVIEFVQAMVVNIFETLNCEWAEYVRRFRSDLIPIPQSFPVYWARDLKKRHGPQYEQIATNEEKQPFWILRPIVMSAYGTATDPLDDTVITQAITARNVSFDLIWPGGFGEALTGSETEYDFVDLLQKMTSRYAALDNFRGYLELAEAGLLPQTAGAGLGIERAMKYITRTRDIRDVMPFAREAFSTRVLF